MGMRDDASGGISESRLLNVWQSQLAVRRDFVSQEGTPFRIVYPGRANRGQGPDVIDAVISRSNRLVRGDIEFHVKSSGWWEHQHHLNPLYDQVILHVVLQPDKDRPATLSNGQPVDTLALSQYAEGSDASAVCAMPCQISTVTDSEQMGTTLDRLGDERFLDKATRLETASREVGHAQCLYQEIMGALGYSRNQAAFKELAGRLPLSLLEKYTRRMPAGEAVAVRQGLLLGAAGMLPSQRTVISAEPWAADMENIWTSNHPVAAMSAGQWNLSGVRPANLPARRIAALSHLIPRFFSGASAKSTLRGILSLSPPDLVKRVTVPAEGFWRRYFDFDLVSVRYSGDLLGAGRASDIVVNVLLPLAYALGKPQVRSGAARQALNLYRSFPGLPSNSIERHMRAQLGWQGKMPGTARRQQGLLYLYREFCSQGKCPDCPLTAKPRGAR